MFDFGGAIVQKLLIYILKNMDNIETPLLQKSWLSILNSCHSAVVNLHIIQFPLVNFASFGTFGRN